MNNITRCLVLIALVVLFVGYPFAVHHFMGDWQLTGQFGDTFGFVNSFVASITVVFVLSAFNLQKKQLEESRQAFRLQQTPIMSLADVEFFLKFPYSKSKDRTFPYPDSGLFLEIKNVSEVPIVNLEGRITVELPNDRVKILDECFMCPILGYRGDTTEKQMLTIRTGNVDVIQQYFKALTEKDSNPVLTCHFKYKNILGGCFEYKRVATLSAWIDGGDVRKELMLEVDKMNSRDPKLCKAKDVLGRQSYMTFWPEYHKCASDYFDHTPYTYKGVQVSQALAPNAVSFRAISSQAYEDLAFLSKTV